MYYPFLEPFIRAHFILGPFQRKHTYLSLPIEGLGLYRVANITTDLPRSVKYEPSSVYISNPSDRLSKDNMGLVSITGEDIEFGQVKVSRTFNDCHYGVEVWEFLRSGANQMYLYESDRLVRVEHWFDQIATCAAYKDLITELDGFEEPAPAGTYFSWDNKGRLTNVERESWGSPMDQSDPHWCAATIEYKYNGDLVILTLEETFSQPEHKYAWLFEDYINKEIIQELALQEPGIQLARTRMSMAEYESQTSVHRLRCR